MAEKIKDEELVYFKEMMTANSIQLDSLAQSLIEKGLNTENEFYGKLNEVKVEHERKEK